MAFIKNTRTFLLITAVLLLAECTQPGSPAQTKSIQPQIGSGVAHTCLLTQQGKVLCWGQGSQLSQEISPDQFGKPLQMEGLDAIHLAAGWYHTCAVTSDGLVKCWGQNSNGQLGDGRTEDSSSPVEVTGLEKVAALTAGAAHSCALTMSGDVYCWGQNTQGQLGDGTTHDRSSAVQVSGLTGRAASISASPSYTCAALRNGQTECWGQLTFLSQQLSQQLHTTPESVPGLTANIEKIAAGDDHLCALTTSGEVKCEGAFFPSGNPPFGQPVGNLGKLQGHIRDLLAGTGFSCVLADTGRVYCWGDNYFDELGDGTNTNSMEPREVSRAGSEVIALGGGHFTACALASAGKVSCWGDTSFGQIGDGTARWK
jgi:alpha-tubulin suppressor-like RCC1 family protein